MADFTDDSGVTSSFGDESGNEIDMADSGSRGQTDIRITQDSEDRLTENGVLRAAQGSVDVDYWTDNSNVFGESEVLVMETKEAILTENEVALLVEDSQLGGPTDDGGSAITFTDLS